MIDEYVPFVRLEVSGIDDPEAGTAIILYVAGCPRRCPGCHNESLQQIDGYPLLSSRDIMCYLEGFFARGEADALIEAIVFQGGDWVEYPAVYCQIAAWARNKGFRTVLYTGEIYENLPKYVREASTWIVDGPWKQDKVSVFPPSSNQRVFHQGRRVDPEQLPLHKHLLESRSVKTGGEEAGRSQ